MLRSLTVGTQEQKGKLRVSRLRKKTGACIGIKDGVGTTAQLYVLLCGEERTVLYPGFRVNGDIISLCIMTFNNLDLGLHMLCTNGCLSRHLPL